MPRRSTGILESISAHCSAVIIPTLTHASRRPSQFPAKLALVPDVLLFTQPCPNVNQAPPHLNNHDILLVVALAERVHNIKERYHMLAFHAVTAAELGQDPFPTPGTRGNSRIISVNVEISDEKQLGR